MTLLVSVLLSAVILLGSIDIKKCWGDVIGAVQSVESIYEAPAYVASRRLNNKNGAKDKGGTVRADKEFLCGVTWFECSPVLARDWPRLFS